MLGVEPGKDSTSQLEEGRDSASADPQPTQLTGTERGENTGQMGMEGLPTSPVPGGHTGGSVRAGSRTQRLVAGGHGRLSQRNGGLSIVASESPNPRVARCGEFKRQEKAALFGARRQSGQVTTPLVSRTTGCLMCIWLADRAALAALPYLLLLALVLL
ncbi:unnamed protein product [Lota lota]